MQHDTPNISQPEVFFRNLLQSAPDAMVIVDEHGKIFLVNSQTVNLFGYERDEMLGQPVEMLMPESLRGMHVEHRNRYVAAPAVRMMGAGLDLFGRRKDGSVFPVEISLSPIKSDDGRFVSSVIRDVSVRHQMEMEIKAARQVAERANKANSAFLAAASHDLRQPVQALSLLNGALRRTVSDERALKMIDSQETSLVAMTNLLNSLLDISRLDAGAVKAAFEDFPMQRLIDRLSAEFDRQASSKGLAFKFEACPAIVHSDPNLLAEILNNLVSNAIRYTNSGEVRVSCIVRGDQCHLEVSDTGIGIEADQLEAIFREFHQCKSPGSNKEGFGLGLAIVRRLADLLGHRVDVQSEPGKGSCFGISVPTVTDSRYDLRNDDSDNVSAPDSAGGLVILIEDDVNVADAWGLLLEAEGYRVATAASAQEATTLIHHLEEEPVLLISDFHLLGGSTGVEAVGLIRAHYDRVIPAFIVSGDTSKVVRDARMLENSTLMSKPIDTVRLLNAARHAIVSGTVPED